MIEGAIAFFRTDAATTLDSIQNTFEAYNAAVALEKTDAGVTFTVDNISVDDNFINLFGRMQATGLRAKLQEANTAETATRCSTADAGSVGFRVQRHAAAGGPCRRRGIRSR